MKLFHYRSNAELIQHIKLVDTRIASEDLLLEYLKSRDTLFDTEGPASNIDITTNFKNRTRTLFFMVSDQGIGISEEAMEKLFGIFIQVCNLFYEIPS